MSIIQRMASFCLISIILISMMFSGCSFAYLTECGNLKIHLMAGTLQDNEMLVGKRLDTGESISLKKGDKTTIAIDTSQSIRAEVHFQFNLLEGNINKGSTRFIINYDVYKTFKPTFRVESTQGMSVSVPNIIETKCSAIPTIQPTPAEITIRMF